MSTVASPAAAAGAPHPGFGNVVRAELTKLFSVRSTFWTLLALVGVSIGMSALICGSVTNPDHDDAIATSLFGLAFGQIGATVLGVLAISTEYSQGGMRTTLTAVPRRGRVLMAKALVVGLVCLVVGLIASFGSFLVGNALLDANDQASLSDAGATRAVLGGGLLVMGVGLFGLGLGAILRQSAGAITAALVLLLVAPPLLSGISGGVGRFLKKDFTTNAGGQITTTYRDPDLLGPWAGYAVFMVWVLALLVIGMVLLRRRDAS